MAQSNQVWYKRDMLVFFTQMIIFAEGPLFQRTWLSLPLTVSQSKQYDYLLSVRIIATKLLLVREEDWLWRNVCSHKLQRQCCDRDSFFVYILLISSLCQDDMPIVKVCKTDKSHKFTRIYFLTIYLSYDVNRQRRTLRSE